MNKKKQEKYEELLEFALEIKKLVRNLGRTNIIYVDEVMYILNKYDI